MDFKRKIKGYENYSFTFLFFATELSVETLNTSLNTKQ